MEVPQIGMTTQVPLREAVADVVKAVAPQEAPVLAALDGFDDAEVLRRLTRRSRSNEPLGFGLDTADVLVTSVVWIAVDETVRRIVDAVADRRGGSGRAHRLGLGRRSTTSHVVPVLTREQLGLLGQAVLQACQDAGLPDERGEQIAGAVVMRMVQVPDAVAEGGADDGAP